MKLIQHYSPKKLLIISLISSLFIIYPDIVCLQWELTQIDSSIHTAYTSFVFFRYFYFTLTIWILLIYNLNKIKHCNLETRAKLTFLITLLTYIIFICMMYLWTGIVRGAGSIVLLQYSIVYLISTFVGHAFMMFNDQIEKEQEIERLKIENLQSRYDALTNQINPHFFFNSLNSLTALIRKGKDENTLSFVNKLSDVFRYILQSDKKGLVTLHEEIEFIDAFRYMMEVRFANKLEFKIEIDNKDLSLKIPVLSMLPLIDNIVVHNMIDSQNKMEVKIFINDKSELVVSNPIHPKLSKPATNGTGIQNLENRFLLLMNSKITFDNNGKVFTVYLPLK